MEQRRWRERLEAIAGDLAWSWSPSGRALFEGLAREAGYPIGRGPWALLARATDAELEAWMEGAGRAHVLAAVERELAHRRDDRPSLRSGLPRARPIAYFCAEFGLHESLRLYSGGLGVLAGDHLKSASDLGVPMVGVGLFYRGGYFEQRLDATGWQHERYSDTTPEAMGLVRAHDRSGAPVTVEVPSGWGPLRAQVWELAVGGVTLVLLDPTDEGEAVSGDAGALRRLYSGDERTRIRQELLLGAGGVRALAALGKRPSVHHLNEGHCAFACLELAADRVEREGCAAADALAEVGETIVFTTHTPVAAGHDRFAPALAAEALAPYAPRLGLTPDELLALGRVDPSDDRAPFCMTTLALRVAARSNGVSFLHGRVSRKMWRSLWPGRRLHEVPIGHVTNGVHVSTWMAPAMQELWEARLGAGWRERVADPATWSVALDLDDATLWGVRQRLRRALIADVRRRATDEARRRGEPEEIVAAMATALDEEALIVGFARRFAAYKRAALLADDLDFLERLVQAPGRPTHFVFAGKAHPRDDGGKRVLQRLFELSRDRRFLGRVVLLEDYDMELGRALTAGVDVWLNTPRRPREASGTSGQKAALNGVLNCSILDGWWAEAFDGDNGFAIGEGEVHRDPKLQDRRDAEALRRTLREEVVPLFFEREGGVPVRWLAQVRRSLATIPWRFCSDRMVADYLRHAYLPLAGATTAEVR